MMKWVLMCLFMFMSPSLLWADDTILKSEAVNQPVRVIHFVLRAVRLQDAYDLVDKAAKAHFNTIQVALTDGVRLKHAPWTPRKDAWRTQELVDWALYARSKGLDVVPEIKFLTHQEKFFQGNCPNLMFNKKTYDPRQEQVYEKVFLLIDEVIELLQPKAIHIGHDEVKGWFKSWKRKVQAALGFDDMLPSALFLKDVLTIHAYLKGKGIETWMWGDMLLSPEELPKNNHKWTPYHGSAKGYGTALRKKLPKDIVICDWQYLSKSTSVPSLNLLKNDGFRVIGTTWKHEKTIANFSAYATKHGAYGMMATTWFHVQRKEWNVVDRIIDFSGQTFLKDFPDAK